MRIIKNNNQAPLAVNHQGAQSEAYLEVGQPSARRAVQQAQIRVHPEPLANTAVKRDTTKSNVLLGVSVLFVIISVGVIALHERFLRQRPGDAVETDSDSDVPELHEGPIALPELPVELHEGPIPPINFPVELHEGPIAVPDFLMELYPGLYLELLPLNREPPIDKDPFYWIRMFMFTTWMRNVFTKEMPSEEQVSEPKTETLSEESSLPEKSWVDLTSIIGCLQDPVILALIFLSFLSVGLYYYTHNNINKED